MIKGIGVDTVAIERIAGIEEKHADKFAMKVLGPTEFTRYQMLNPNKRTSFLAKRFAAKEAALKALGTGLSQGISFRDIEVINNDKGQPALQFDGAFKTLFEEQGLKSAHLSITDEAGLATAFAVFSA